MRFLKSLLPLLALFPALALAQVGDVGGYPNATLPFNGAERLLASQSGITVNITTAQMLAYLSVPGNFLPIFVSGECLSNAGGVLLWVPCVGTAGGSDFELQYNNSGSFGGIALGTTGQALVSDGSSGAPAFSSSLPDVTSVNGTSIPNDEVLLTTISGNAVTASSLLSTPTLCTSGEAAQGVLANGDATGCFTPSGSGTISAAAQYSTPYYSASGSATTLSGLASPTSGPGYFSYRYDPTGSGAVAPTLDQDGAITRSISGSATTDTVAYSDVFGIVIHDLAATGAVDEMLPTPTTLNNTHFGYTYCNRSPQTDTITPVTWTISKDNGSAGALISVTSGECEQIVIDPFNSDQWDAFSSGNTSSLTQTSPLGFTNGSISEDSTSFIGPNSLNEIGPLIPFAGTFNDLNIRTASAPASGQTFTFTLYYEGPTSTSYSTTGITCQITSSSTNNSCSDTTDTFSFSAGTNYLVQVAASATSGSTGQIGIGFNVSH